MAMGNSAKQQWASLNKHFLSITSLFVNFYCKYMFICRQVKYSRFKNKINDIVIAGGVAANSSLRKKLSEFSNKLNIFYPSIEICTDNAAMIGRCALKAYKLQRFSKLNEININPKISF